MLVSMIPVLQSQVLRFWFIAAVLACGSCRGHSASVVEYPANPAQGFHSPYYLGRPLCAEAKTVLIVEANNTGTSDDNFATHDRAASNLISSRMTFAADLRSPFLVPAFPRPDSNWWVYTHALDRDTFETEIPELRRLDLQLMAMIEDARIHLASAGITIDPKIFIMGFSASGMFANRFAMLHPTIVKAAAVGSPGGWPLAPVAAYQGQALRYNIGIADLLQLVGTSFDSQSYVAVPHYFFIGDQDANDSVPYDDSYDPDDAALVDELFGTTPMERWPVAQSIYESAGCNAQFVTYPGVGHSFT